MLLWRFELGQCDISLASQLPTLVSQTNGGSNVQKYKESIGQRRQLYRLSRSLVNRIHFGQSVVVYHCQYLLTIQRNKPTMATQQAGS